MDTARHKEIMAHVEVQFYPQNLALRDAHNQELREAQSHARKTNNTAAMLPAEAACYVAHTKAVVVARAKCIADAYTTFNEPIGPEAESELTSFFAMTVAVRRSSFEGEAQLRQMRTNVSTSQLPHLLRAFEREAHPSLVEGRAILNKQQVDMHNRQHIDATKYLVDTSVFNWLADSRIDKNKLPSDGGFAITHIQVDEINKTRDEERRARLSLMYASLHCKLIPTRSFVFDVSRFDHAMLGDGKVFNSLKSELDLQNQKKKNNTQDALIAESAIVNGYTLLTADEDLKYAVEKLGGKVIFFSHP